MARKIITADEVTNELPSSAKFGSGSEMDIQIDSKVSAKQDKGDYVLATDSRLTDARTPKTHTHATADITGLQAALDAKAVSNHTHTVANVTGLQSALDAKAASSHTHTIANVTGLQAALDAKATASALSDLVARVEALESGESQA